MKKYRLYRVDFFIPKKGHVHIEAIELNALSSREALAETRKLVFTDTGEHAFRCKAKLVNL